MTPEEKAEKRNVLKQIDDIKSALSDSYGVQHDARRTVEMNRELKRQLQVLETKASLAQKDKEKLIAIKRKLMRSQAENDRVSKQKEKLLQNIELAKDDIAALRKKLDSSVNEREKIKKVKSGLEERLRSSEHLREMTNDEKRAIIDDLEKLRKDHDSTKKTLVKSQRDLSNLQRELARSQKSRERITEDFDQMKVELRRARDSAAELEGKKAAFEEETYNLRKDVQVLERGKISNDALKHDLESSQNEIVKYEEEKANLEGKIRDLHGEVAHLRKEIEIGKEDFREYQARSSSLASQAERLQIKLAEMEVEIEVSQRQIVDLESQLAEESTAKLEAERSATDRVEELHGKLTTTDLKLVEAEDARDNLASKIKRLQQINEDRTESIKILEKELNEQAAEFNELRLASNETERRLHERIGEIEGSIARKNVAVDELQKEKDNLADELSQVQFDLRETRKNLDSESKNFSREQEEWVKIKEELASTHGIVQSLKNELLEVSKEKSELEKKAVKEELDVQQAEAKLERGEIQSAEAIKKSNELEKNLLEAKKTIEQLRGEVDKAKKESGLKAGEFSVEDLHGESSEEPAKPDKPEEKESGTPLNKRLSKQVTELEEELAEKDIELQKIRADRDDLSEKVDSLETLLTEGAKADSVTKEKALGEIENLEATLDQFTDEPPETENPEDFSKSLIEELSLKPVEKVFFERLAPYLEPGHSLPKVEPEALNSVISAIMGLIENKPLDALTPRSYGAQATHAYRVAVISVILAKHHGIPGNAIIEVGTAALLHDIGMENGESGRLYGKFMPPKEKTRYRNHPIRGSEEAAKIPGISENVVRAIMEHHENINGTGFPNSLADQAIHEYAKIIAIADRFDKLVHPEQGIEPLLPAMAMKELLLATENGEIDSSLVRSFLNGLGLFPIGSFAKLKTGEIVRVLDVNPSDAKRPKVVMLQDPRGHVLEQATRINMMTSKDLVISGPVWGQR